MDVKNGKRMKKYSNKNEFTLIILFLHDYL